MQDEPAADKISALLALSHALGEERRALAILGEGNTSTRAGADTFLVKASGSSLGTMTAAGVVECRAAPLLEMLGRDGMSDQQIEDALFDSRVSPAAKKPSVEALFHAYLLSLPGIHFVGHTHPVSVNSILCSPRAAEFAHGRIFPDEVVCCGPASVLVPYTDPGLPLAQAIRRKVGRFMEKRGVPPRVVLLENHGIITFGASPEAVKAAMFMADKAAKIFLAATSLGGPRFLSAREVERIASRLDEHYRQRMLKI
jgi:rhamnose utilization protein RhaD (predicted bifunctional aldolase and dehydrogenase)